jgi:hypothetical protein
VIATGFGPARASHPAASAADTPVDMAPYSEHPHPHPRPRPEPPVSVSVDRLAVPRLTLARRALADIQVGSPLPVAPSVAAATLASGTESAEAPGLVAADEASPDFDLSSTFDVPAFLRRQEG